MGLNYGKKPAASRRETPEEKRLKKRLKTARCHVPHKGCQRASVAIFKAVPTNQIIASPGHIFVRL
jgi:hypothetical protein